MTCSVINTSKRAFFFDMDGVIFDSMPNHAAAWDDIMRQHGLDFTARDCYLQEGRTGQDVIREAILKTEHREATEEEIWSIYQEKTDSFLLRGGAPPMAGAREVLEWLQAREDTQIFIVTGSGQQSLFDTLDEHFPGIFVRERMVTAFDVEHGKPHPEPYLKAWMKSGLSKEECCVVENAPLGVRAGKAAGLDVIAVNTGPLMDEDLLAEGADVVLPDMPALLRYLQQIF